MSTLEELETINLLPIKMCNQKIASKAKSESKTKSKPKKPRCFHCKGKLGPVKFECKCSTKKLCIKCRLPESHNCQYDFKKESRQFLENKLVKVTHDKVIKI